MKIKRIFVPLSHLLSHQHFASFSMPWFIFSDVISELNFIIFSIRNFFLGLAVFSVSKLPYLWLEG